MQKYFPICPVCGYDGLDEPPYNEYGDPSHEICSCCGFEYGFHDGFRNYTFKVYRKEWIEGGFNFNWDEDEPDNWNEEQLKKQLKNIKKVDYKPRI